MSTIAENIDGLVSCRTIMRLKVTQARVATNEYCKLTRVSSVMVGGGVGLHTPPFGLSWWWGGVATGTVATPVCALRKRMRTPAPHAQVCVAA